MVPAFSFPETGTEELYGGIRARTSPDLSRGGAWHVLRTHEGMSFCASCGLQLAGDTALCPHHHCVYGDDWAVANRIMCDFFHRGTVPTRLAPNERDDDFWGRTGEAA